MVDLGDVLGLENEGDDTLYSGVEVWVIDARRPWNLGNVFGGFPLETAAEPSSSYQSRIPAGVAGGRIGRSYKPGKGGIIVFDDGDIEDDLEAERTAYKALLDMPDIDDDGEDIESEYDIADGADLDEEEVQETTQAGQKRKSWSDSHEDGLSDDDDDRPAQRRRSNMVRKSHRNQARPNSY
jgi:cell division control protein 45